MIRRAAHHALAQWRDVLIALPILALGGMGLLHYSYLYNGLGVGLIVVGGALLRSGLQRARLRGAVPASGVVTLDEGQITYLAPTGGGALALDTIMAIHLLPGADPRWHLSTALQDDLSIPVGAHNGELLLDAFTSLPGFRSDRMIAALRTAPTAPITIWRRPNAVIDTTHISPQV